MMKSAWMLITPSMGIVCVIKAALLFRFDSIHSMMFAALSVVLFSLARIEGKGV